MSTIKGIIFDFGGTIDTNGIHWGELIWEQYRQVATGIDKETFRNAYIHGERSLAKARIIEPSDTFRTMLEKKIALQIAFLNETMPYMKIGNVEGEEILRRCYNKVETTLETTRPIVEKLSALYPTVLVTNFYGNMPVVLEEFALSGYFNEIIESSVVGIRKPDPALFALGVDKLGTHANETLVIGDSYKKDIYPSSALGCKSVWLKKICWAEESIEPGFEPAAIIDSLEKLPVLIEKSWQNKHLF